MFMSEIQIELLFQFKKSFAMRLVQQYIRSSMNRNIQGKILSQPVSVAIKADCLFNKSKRFEPVGKFISVSSLLWPINRHNFSTVKQSPQSGLQSEPGEKDLKVLQLKQLFQTKMDKYNLKGLLKMYQILTHNNIELSEQSLKLFQYRLLQQLNQMDHQTTNSILEMMHKNGQCYQSKGKSKLIRGINLKLQRNRLPLVSELAYMTVRLIVQMKFPKSTLSKLLYKLVVQNQVDKRLLYHMENLKALKVSLLAIQTMEVDLQIKKRILQNMLRIKPKGVVQTTYFHSVLKVAVSQLQKTVKYQSQKKAVYNLAFNPYSMYEAEDVQAKKKGQNQNETNHPPPTNKQKPQHNPNILQRLLDQKQKILQQTFQKFDVKLISQQIQMQVSQYLKSPRNDQLSFKQLKQLGLMLISNGFAEQNNQNRKTLLDLVQKVIDQGLFKVQDSGSLDSSNVLRVGEFVVFAKQMQKNTDKQQFQSWFNKYSKLYREFMNLQQKLILTYHRSKLLNQSISLNQLKSLVTQTHYGMDSEQFIWLNKILLSLPQSLKIQQQQQIKQIWALIEAKIDRQIGQLREERQNKSKSNKKHQTGQGQSGQQSIRKKNQ